MDEPATAPTVATPSFREAVVTFAKIGVLSFGGPAGQIALMHRVLVEEKRWIGESRYLSALNFCMLLPGPEAMQLATYAGWSMHGVAGGLAAGLLFVLPGALVILALALGYSAFGAMPFVTAIFSGIKAAVVAIVIEALLRVARRALKGPVDWMIAGAAFFGIFLFSVPFPLIILFAAAIGFWRGERRQLAGLASVHPSPIRVTARATVRTVFVWLGIWTIPLGAVALVFGREHVLTELAIFFSTLAVVTFGGAYAVLAYMAQEVVGHYGWLAPGEMLDALGLAETTPGPLILVTEFVSVVTAYRHGGGMPVLMGVLGAVVSLWATFAPCFLWIFAGAPYIEWLNEQPRLRSALSAVTAAVVGVILNLSVWFALHVMFAEVRQWAIWPLSVSMPLISSVIWEQIALSAVSLAVLLGLKRGVLTTLAVASALSLLSHALSS